MNIQSIKEIVNSNISDDMKEDLIISVLASDESVIPTMLKILQEERNKKKELIIDMNLELSRAHIYIYDRPETKTEAKQAFNKSFIMDEIAKFYIKYKGVITHCFNRFN